MGVKLLQVEAAAVDAVARNPQLPINALVKRLSLAHAVVKASVERVYQQRPTLAEQLDPSSSLSMMSKDGGLAGKLNLAMQVLAGTKSIPESIPMSVIQESIAPQYLKEFAAAQRKN